ncbi:hypothetical protein ACIQXD_02945 [Streptomyces uncialis]|uniref:hypothetical protein n=1 Tax=Streptomyces uncialis TaxID=1048205 RepID=UPI00381CB05D
MDIGPDPPLNSDSGRRVLEEQMADHPGYAGPTARTGGSVPRSPRGPAAPERRGTAR